MEKGKKLAVLVGCNYPNTKNELHGCHNDVLAMRDVLIHKLRFRPENIELLTDKPGSSVMPTGANIMKSLHAMVGRARPGDVLYFHYSGHGTLIEKNPFLPFLKEEAIVPTDFNLITNVDLRNLVNKVPTGATFTILSDSCHSGGLIDKEKQQIGPSKNDQELEEEKYSGLSCRRRPKFIPLESVLGHLSSLTNINTKDIGTHLLEIFGADASLGFRQRPDQAEPEEDTGKKAAAVAVALSQDEGILLSGCQADETSADVVSEKGMAYGAFSNAVQEVLKQLVTPDHHDQKASLSSMSNREVVSMARKFLRMRQFKQHPCLYCSDQNADAPFLSTTTATQPT